MEQKQKNKVNKRRVNQSAKQFMQRVQMYAPVSLILRGMPDIKTNKAKSLKLNDSHSVCSFQASKPTFS